MLLRSLIGFAFAAGEPHVNCGIMFPIVSIALASLMALFRDGDAARKLSVEELTLLVRETGTALLDSRLSSEELDEEAGLQMTKAVNKVCW